MTFETKGHFLYHSGPIGKRSGKKWRVTSAPPDPSGAHEIYQGELMGRFGIPREGLVAGAYFDLLHGEASATTE